jgi:glyoxylase-like metal-dependent hydrolase (beta-lactamase superfamily II)/rhodanese-related sulfurtransferase
MLKIKQFYDKGLAHASYALISDGQMAVLDPARNPQPYLDFAQEEGVKITHIFETHPHADFVSSHAELHRKTGAPIYVSQKLKADYEHIPLKNKEEIRVGKVKIVALETPGHSPDSLTFLVIDENGRQHSAFTGDTLFVGDVGRPDLREESENNDTKRESLARQMYRSTREVIMKLNREVLVYPAHGAGSLCGKNLSSDTVSTIGRELDENPALQEKTEDEFVKDLLEDQPFIPKYFKYNVAMNQKGAPDYGDSLREVPRITKDESLDSNKIIVDSRSQEKFKNCHIEGSLNIQNGGKFETWLGSIVAPEEKFYLIAGDEGTLTELIEKSAKIGYEQNIAGALVNECPGQQRDKFINLEHFKASPTNYTIIDIRNESEFKENHAFDHAINIPLPQLRERTQEIPTDKPVVVHCAAGYRSAIGYSILEDKLPDIEVYDLGEAVKEYL